MARWRLRWRLWWRSSAVCMLLCMLLWGAGSCAYLSPLSSRPTLVLSWCSCCPLLMLLAADATATCASNTKLILLTQQRRPRSTLLHWALIEQHIH